MEKQNAAFSQFETNLAQLEEEHLQDEAEVDKLIDTDRDPLNVEANYLDRDVDGIHALERQFEELEQWIADHQYEIENQFSIFDWLKIYGECVKLYGLQESAGQVSTTEGQLSGKDW